MNEQFFHLPEEKQQAIINASLEVFATHEYKRPQQMTSPQRQAFPKDCCSTIFIIKKVCIFFFMIIRKKL